MLTTTISILAYKETLLFLAAFLLIAVAADRIAKLVQKIGLPFITGLLFIGIAAGPFVLKMFPQEAHPHLNFINEIALAFIAFAAGSELYLKELRDRIKQIYWITFGQLVVTFGISTTIVYFLSEQIAFMKGLPTEAKLGIAILTGTIFVARSPSSAIAVINELRAKGPFTQSALGVTVLIDVLVIILFAISFALAKSMVNSTEIGLGFIALLLFELFLSFGLGYLLGKLLSFLLTLDIPKKLKSVLILLTGYLVYVFAHLVRTYSHEVFGVEILLEPLLICIIASFVVANFTKNRLEFLSIMKEMGPMIYVAFFTLTGLSLSFDKLIAVWEMALLLFFVRLLSVVIGAFVGGTLARDPLKFNLLGWMPYVTQAGIGLGLATIVAAEFPEWGESFLTLIIAVIVINQIVGPPLFKWAIKMVHEDHPKAGDLEGDELRDAIIFGMESQSIALARQLISHGWKVKIATLQEESGTIEDVEIVHLSGLSKEDLAAIECKKANTLIVLLDDDRNYSICELAYEHLGTKNVIVRLHDRSNIEKFQELGVKIVEPNMAMVGLLEHLVRSPNATSLLLGMEADQDTIDIEVRNRQIHGLALRDLRFPSDVLILAVKRKGSGLISHGFTRLRLGDTVTLVGSVKSLDEVRLQLSA